MQFYCYSKDDIHYYFYFGNDLVKRSDNIYVFNIKFENQYLMKNDCNNIVYIKTPLHVYYTTFNVNTYQDCTVNDGVRYIELDLNYLKKYKKFKIKMIVDI